MPGEGLLLADLIIAEHYRLGSSMAILSRSFCDLNVFKTQEDIRKRFESGIKRSEVLKNFFSHRMLITLQQGTMKQWRV